jgi:archaellum component FlaC
MVVLAMEDRDMLREVVLDALHQVIPPVSKAIGNLQKDVLEIKKRLSKVENKLEVIDHDLAGVKSEVTCIKSELADVKSELRNKPDRGEVRTIVREELHRELYTGRFRLIPDEDWAKS